MSGSKITIKSDMEATIEELLIAFGNIKGVTLTIHGQSIEVSPEDWEFILGLAWEGYNDRTT